MGPYPALSLFLRMTMSGKSDRYSGNGSCICPFFYYGNNASATSFFCLVPYTVHLVKEALRLFQHEFRYFFKQRLFLFMKELVQAYVTTQIITMLQF